MHIALGAQLPVEILNLRRIYHHLELFLGVLLLGHGLLRLIRSIILSHQRRLVTGHLVSRRGAYHCLKLVNRADTLIVLWLLHDDV